MCHGQADMDAKYLLPYYFSYGSSVCLDLFPGSQLFAIDIFVTNMELFMVR